MLEKVYKPSEIDDLLLFHLSERGWKQIQQLMARIDRTSSTGYILIKIIHGKDESFKKQVPTKVYAPSEDDINELFHKLYECGVILNFNWKSWSKGRDMVENPFQDFSKLQMSTLMKLVTAITRNDKFCDGYFNVSLRDGTLMKILYALDKRLNEHWNPTPILDTELDLFSWYKKNHPVE